MKLFLALFFAVFSLALSAAETTIEDTGWSLRVQSSSPEHTTLTLTVDDWRAAPVEIDGRTYYIPVIGDMERTYEKGAPALPKLARSLMIPADARMTVRVTHAEYTDHPLPVAPSKGVLLRTVDPATVDYTFGEAYAQSEPWPAALAELGEPYILRDVRGLAVTLHPMQYLPQQGLLRVYSQITVEIFADGVDDHNVLASHTESANRTWDAVYSNRFVNYPLDRYALVPEFGRMIVICQDEWADEIAPWVAWKNQRGVRTNVYLLSTVGSTAAEIDAFIEMQYNAHSDLTFVTLVGDGLALPPMLLTGYSCDPLYACITGDDYYPELFVGRISAETAGDVTTQVERFLDWERDLTTAPWLADGMGVASSQGAGQGDDGESDWQHMDNIRTDLLGYTYGGVDQIYDTTGGNASMVSSGVNTGRSVINYCGHGSAYSWVSTGYNSTYINNLTNVGKTPYIYSVACQNGNFRTITCFAESWMRAVDSANLPIGAVGFYGASINQSWAPPMCAQDEFVDLLCAGTLDTFGALCYNSSCQMMDEYGDNGELMYLTWHVFGDPSLTVRTAEPQPLAVSIPATLPQGAMSFTVNAGVPGALVGVSREGEFIAAAFTGNDGEAVIDFERPASAGETYHVVVTRRNAEAWQGDVAVSGTPPQVTGVTAVMRSGELELSWDAYAGALRYNIYYSVEPDGPFVLLTSSSTTSRALTFGGVIPDLERAYFRVTAMLSD